MLSQRRWKVRHHAQEVAGVGKGFSGELERGRMPVHQVPGELAVRQQRAKVAAEPGRGLAGAGTQVHHSDGVSGIGALQQGLRGRFQQRHGLLAGGVVEGRAGFEPVGGGSGHGVLSVRWEMACRARKRSLAVSCQR